MIEASEERLATIMAQDLALVGQRFDRVEADIFELKTDVAILKTDVAILKTDVAELKTDVSVLKVDVAELKIDMREVKWGLADTVRRGEFLDVRSRVEHLEHHSAT